MARASQRQKKSAGSAAKKKSGADVEPIKICMCDRGEDVETPWAIDLGPATGKVPEGSRRVRLVNVPFFHAKPTWGDVIVVSPVDDGLLTWDAKGVAWSKIGTRIDEDGGRFAMIVDYVPEGDDKKGDAAFAAIQRACHGKAKDLLEAPIVCEGAYGPADGRAGRVYLAVQDELEPEQAMARLQAAKLPCELIQIHPTPEKKAKSAAKKPAAKAKSAKAPAKKPAAAKAKAKTKAKKPPAKKPTTKSKR